MDNDKGAGGGDGTSVDPTPLLSDSHGNLESGAEGQSSSNRSRSDSSPLPLELDGSEMPSNSSSTSKKKKKKKKQKKKGKESVTFLLSKTDDKSKADDGEDAAGAAAEGQDAAGVNIGESAAGGGASYCDAAPALDDADADDDYYCEDDGYDTNNPLSSSSQFPTHGSSYSLAFSSSTPRWAVYLVSTLMLVTHGLFLYGQLAPMWRLRCTADIDVWANATTNLSGRTFDALGLARQTHYTLDYDDDVSTFTYGFAIKQLWAAAGLPNKTMSRLAAALLVIFSGVWPHLKLLLLHATFLIRRTERTRTSSLYWLGAFGKWTLADVFVVCVMIGVVNLDWAVDPGAIRDGLSDELPTLVMVAKSMYTSPEACTKMLGFECKEGEPWAHRAKCWGCEAVVNEAYSHPGWARGAGRDVLRGVATSGGGAVELRVAGMRGIYPFCAAAIFSLLLGVAVDLLDHRARVRSMSSSGGGGGGSDGRQPSSFSPSARHGRFAVLLRRVVPRGGAGTWCREVAAWFGYGILILASLLTALLVALGCAVPTMEREVVGAIPNVAHDVLGIAWERPYSLWSLVGVSGAEGGPDYLLMGTFAIFVLVGPVLRSALIVANLVLPMTEACHEFFLTTINFVGAFCAWEVFAIAVIMVDDLIPTITNTILQRPVCEQLSPEEDGSCLEIEFNVLDSFFGLVAAGGTMLVLVATVAVKLGFRGVDPYKDGDEGGPYMSCCKPCRRAGAGEPYQERDNNADAYFHLGEDDMVSETEILL